MVPRRRADPRRRRRRRPAGGIIPFPPLPGLGPAAVRRRLAPGHQPAAAGRGLRRDRRRASPTGCSATCRSGTRVRRADLALPRPRHRRSGTPRPSARRGSGPTSWPSAVCCCSVGLALSADRDAAEPVPRRATSSRASGGRAGRAAGSPRSCWSPSAPLGDAALPAGGSGAPAGAAGRGRRAAAASSPSRWRSSWPAGRASWRRSRSPWPSSAAFRGVPARGRCGRPASSGHRASWSSLAAPGLWRWSRREGGAARPGSGRRSARPGRAPRRSRSRPASSSAWPCTARLTILVGFPFLMLVGGGGTLAAARPAGRRGGGRSAADAARRTPTPPAATSSTRPTTTSTASRLGLPLQLPRRLVDQGHPLHPAEPARSCCSARRDHARRLRHLPIGPAGTALCAAGNRPRALRPGLPAGHAGRDRHQHPPDEPGLPARPARLAADPAPRARSGRDRGRHDRRAWPSPS